MRRLIVFLIRRRLGLKSFETFQFTNQNSETEYYYFTETGLMKVSGDYIAPSKVSLNWLLDTHCLVKRIYL